MDRKKIFIGIFVGIFLFSVFVQIGKVNASNSAVLLGSSYTEQFQDLANASFYENVEISDGCLTLAVGGYLPNDNWTEQENMTNGVNGWWYASEDVAVNESRLNVFHYDLSINDNYSTEIELTDTGAGDIFQVNFLAVDPDTYDVTDYTNLRWYFCMLTPSAVDNPLRLLNVTLTDNNTVAKTSTLLVNESVTNTWNLFDVVLEDFFTEDSFNYTGLTQISWLFSWDTSMLEENITLLYDHLDFYAYEDNGTFVSNWVRPLVPFVLWENAICWTTNPNLTTFSVSWDNVTWYPITAVNGSSTQLIDNLLVSLGYGYLTVTQPLLFKVVLEAGSSPSVDFVIIEYYDLTTLLLMMQLAQVDIIIPNAEMNNLIWLLYGIGTVALLWDIYNKGYRKMKKANNNERLKAIVAPLLALILFTVVALSITTIYPQMTWENIQRLFGYIILSP